MYVCCMHMCIHRGTHICVCMIEELTIRCRPQFLYTLHLQISSFANLELSDRLDWLVSEVLEESILSSLPPSPVFAGTCCHAWIFTCGPKSGPCAVQQTHYPPSHLPSPTPSLSCDLVTNRGGEQEKEVDYPEAREHFDAVLDPEPKSPGPSGTKESPKVCTGKAGAGAPEMAAAHPWGLTLVLFLFPHLPPHTNPSAASQQFHLCGALPFRNCYSSLTFGLKDRQSWDFFLISIFMHYFNLHFPDTEPPRVEDFPPAHS